MANLHPTAWVAPGAYLRGDVTLGEQTNVWYNAVLRADQEKITIGAFLTSRTTASSTATQATT